MSIWHAASLLDSLGLTPNNGFPREWRHSSQVGPGPGVPTLTGVLFSGDGQRRELGPHSDVEVAIHGPVIFASKQSPNVDATIPCLDIRRTPKKKKTIVGGRMKSLRGLDAARSLCRNPNNARHPTSALHSGQAYGSNGSKATRMSPRITAPFAGTEYTWSCPRPPTLINSRLRFNHQGPLYTSLAAASHVPLSLFKNRCFDEHPPPSRANQRVPIPALRWVLSGPTTNGRLQTQRDREAPGFLTGGHQGQGGPGMTGLRVKSGVKLGASERHAHGPRKGGPCNSLVIPPASDRGEHDGAPTLRLNQRMKTDERGSLDLFRPHCKTAPSHADATSASPHLSPPPVGHRGKSQESWAKE